MGWERMKSAEERRKDGKIRGFMPFTEGTYVVGRMDSVHLKDNGTGFFLVRLTEPCTVNVRDEDSKTGQGKASVGDLVGVRKTGASKVMRDIPIGTLVMVTYNQLTEKLTHNPATGLDENNPFHDITVDVYRPEPTEGNQ
jgi:hypothetical protein